VTLYLIVGPPAAGKSTWVTQHAKPGDITIDYDTIASVLSPLTDTYDQPAHVKSVTKAARQAAIDTAIRFARNTDVYVIHSSPSAALLTKYQTLGAQVVTVDPGRDVVLERCKTERPWQMGQAAKQWYRNQDDQHEGGVDEQPTVDLGHPSEAW